MIAKSTKEFQNNVLKKMTFTAILKIITYYTPMKIKKILAILLNIQEKDIMILELVIILFQMIFLFHLNIMKNL